MDKSQVTAYYYAYVKNVDVEDIKSNGEVHVMETSIAINFIHADLTSPKDVTEFNRDKIAKLAHDYIANNVPDQSAGMIVMAKVAADDYRIETFECPTGNALYLTHLDEDDNAQSRALHYPNVTWPEYRQIIDGIAEKLGLEKEAFFKERLKEEVIIEGAEYDPTIVDTVYHLVITPEESNAMLKDGDSVAEIIKGVVKDKAPTKCVFDLVYSADTNEYEARINTRLTVMAGYVCPTPIGRPVRPFKLDTEWVDGKLLKLADDTLKKFIDVSGKPKIMLMECTGISDAVKPTKITLPESSILDRVYVDTNSCYAEAAENEIRPTIAMAIMSSNNIMAGLNMAVYKACEAGHSPEVAASLELLKLNAEIKYEEGESLFYAVLNVDTIKDLESKFMPMTALIMKHLK